MATKADHDTTVTSNGGDEGDGVRVFVGGIEVEIGDLDQKQEVEVEKPEKDERLMGYVFPFHNGQGKTPLDFAIDNQSGRQNGTAVFQISKVDLRRGIDKCNIPCLYTWKLGRWLSDFEDADAPLDELEISPHNMSKVNAEKRNWDYYIWVVHGEGLPGAFSYYAYLLPDSRCKEQIPRHPLLWTKKQKEGRAESFKGKTHYKWASAPQSTGYGSTAKYRYEDSWKLLKQGYLYISPDQRGGGGGGSPGSTWLPGGGRTIVAPPTPVTPVVKADPLPAGVRFRCGGCGHWFDESGFKAHVKVCPQKDGGGFADWAIMCHKDCGCEVIAGQPLGDKTLDHVATCKPGFPRPSTKQEEVEVKEKKGEVTAGE